MSHRRTIRFTEWRPDGALRQFGSQWQAAIGELIVSCVIRTFTAMRITWNELIVDFEKPGADDLLSDWRWLVGDSMRLLLVHLEVKITAPVFVKEEVAK